MNSDDLTLEVRPLQCYGSDSRNIMTALIVMLASKKNVVQSSLQFHRNVWTCYRLGNTGAEISLEFQRIVDLWQLGKYRCEDFSAISWKCGNVWQLGRYRCNSKCPTNQSCQPYHFWVDTWVSKSESSAYCWVGWNNLCPLGSTSIPSYFNITSLHIQWDSGVFSLYSNQTWNVKTQCINLSSL